MNKQKKEIDVQNKVAHHYEKLRNAKGYCKLYNAYWYRIMIDDNINKDDFVLDNGCGNSTFADYFKGKVMGLDISDEMLKYAKKRMEVRKGSSEKLPFKDEMFDVVFCRSLLHHLKNPRQAVREIYRVLKPRGRIIVSEPISNPISHTLRKIVQNPEHFSELHRDFKRKEFIGLFPKGKFEIVKRKNFGFLAYPLLGFPDIISVFEYFPFKMFFARLLIKIDSVLSYMFPLNRLSWHLMLVLKKKG